jgi:spoIIIJ-associated protein
MGINVVEKNIQLALVRAAGLLSVTQDQLEYQIVSESNGLFGIFGKKVAIEAWKKGERRPPRQTTATKKTKSNASSNAQRAIEDTQEKARLIEELKVFFAEICQHMSPNEGQVRVETIEDGDRIVFDVDDEYLASQMIKDSRVAEAFEHILRKKPKNLRQDPPFRIFVDGCGLRMNRELELIQTAKDLSAKVSKDGKPVVLDYNSSYDRKIIHMALDEDKRVFTKSVGTGKNRKLMIVPARDYAAEAT